MHNGRVSVKALEIIWHQLTMFNSHNTVHVDDNADNFSLNPNQGLKIIPYKINKYDNQLEILSLYLVNLASVQDFEEINHTNWQRDL